jgi:hypothetical protein
MANFKRKKSKRIVRCTLCTPHRWQGNGRNRFKPVLRSRRDKQAARAILREGE